VHCMAGVSRSPSVVIAYLMHSEKLSFDQALSLLKHARPVVEPNCAFIYQLQLFEKMQFVLEPLEDDNPAVGQARAEYYRWRETRQTPLSPPGLPSSFRALASAERFSAFSPQPPFGFPFTGRFWSIVLCVFLLFFVRWIF